MQAAIGQLLDNLKEHGGLKSADVANVTAVSPATVSRWTSGKASPHPKTQLLISDLRLIVDRLSDYYTPEQTRLWLYAKHPLLNDQRAIDFVHAGKSEEVLEVIEQLDAGVYL